MAFPGTPRSISHRNGQRDEQLNPFSRIASPKGQAPPIQGQLILCESRLNLSGHSLQVLVILLKMGHPWEKLMRKCAWRCWLSIAILGFAAGCGRFPGATTSGGGSSPPSTQFSLTIRDTPPSNVSVLAFGIQVTGAVLQPGNVSLLSSGNSVQLELTQLQTEATLLSSLSVPAGNYTSLTVTFANPRLTILNSANSAIAGCAAGAVCQFTPAISPLSTTFSTGPNFPLTLLQGVPVGFELDLDLNSIIQTDLSLNLAAANAVNLTQLPTAQATSQLADLNDVRGTVQSIGTNQFTMVQSNGTSLTVNVNSSTVFLFSASSCPANNFTCVAVGQILETDLSLLGNGTLVAKLVELTQPPAVGSQIIQGTIVALSGSPVTSLQLVAHDVQPNSSNVSTGNLVTVNVQNTATFQVATRNFTFPSGISFASQADLITGQEIQVRVAGAVTPGSPPSFTTDQVILVPTQATALVFTINLGAASFTINGLQPFFTNAIPTPINQITEQTSSQTIFENLATSNLTSLAAGNQVSVEGWFFNTPSAPTPATMVTFKVRGRSILH
jgi:hypothetical protein